MNTKNTFTADLIWTIVICIVIFFGLWYILSLFGLSDVEQQAHTNIIISGIISGIVSISLFIVRLRYLLKNK